jgi:hypothetical protein
MNAKDDLYDFRFDGVLDMLTQQETVFNTIAKDVYLYNAFNYIAGC